MKKLFSKLSIAALILSLMFVFVACDVDYGGKYTEVTEADKKLEIVAELEAIIDSGVSAWPGYKASFEMKVVAMGITTNMKGVGYTKIENGDIAEMGVEMDVTSFGVKIDSKVYLKDGWLYTYSKMGDLEEKIKMNVADLGSALELEDLLGVGMDAESILEAFGDISSAGNFKVFTTAEDGKRNIKITDAVESLCIIFALDKNDKIMGIKIEGEIIESGIVSNVVQTIEPYSGTIKFPKDLDTYTETSLGDMGL